jgi:hypothetical protein
MQIICLYAAYFSRLAWLDRGLRGAPTIEIKNLTAILPFASREHWKDGAHWDQTMTKAIDLGKIVKAIKRKANFKLGDSMS